MQAYCLVEHQFSWGPLLLLSLWFQNDYNPFSLFCQVCFLAISARNETHVFFMKHNTFLCFAWSSLLSTAVNAGRVRAEALQNRSTAVFGFGPGGLLGYRFP